MRYYLGMLEYKWSHVETRMEDLWVRRKLGDELYRTVEENNWTWQFIRSGSQTLPEDTFCRCDIYVESNDDKLDSHFLLKFPQAVATPLAK